MHIIVAPIDDDNDLVGASAFGIDATLKGKGDDREERSDGIMQILRTVCLECTPPTVVFISFHFHLSTLVSDGASLFYNRQHAMSCISTRCTPPCTSRSSGSLWRARQHGTQRVSVSHSPRTLDRDYIRRSHGRDSWAKIAALRDGCDAKSQGEGFPITAQRAKFTEHI